MDKDDIYEYNYLNDEIKKKREDVLIKYVKEDDESDLAFYGLDFFNCVNSKRSKLLNVFRRSLINQEIILNDYQIEILSILENNNLFLSAPTSFGKTFIVLEYLMRHKDNIRNAVFIVPTLALMNEIIKKIHIYFSDSYNICINADETCSERNIFVFVPERSGDNFFKLLKNKDIKIDLLVFDELYKLKAKSNGDITKDGRIIIMNKAYLDMVGTANKIILLAPFVKEVKFERTHLDIIKYYSNFSPVYNNVEICEESCWLDLLETNNQKLIYFRRPTDIYDYVKEFINHTEEDVKYSRLYGEEIEYLENNYSSDWVVIKLLKRGYGIHHGKTPMFLRKFYETQYNTKQLKGLFCTSTLMEGINTPTQAMIILGELKDNFELNNLMGRVGRLTGDKPLIGNIFICNEKAKDLFSNNLDGWLNLQILAERNKPTNNEERFMLYTSNDLDDDDSKLYKKELEAICEFAGKTEEEIKAYDVKFVKLKRFVSENFKDRFLQINSLYNLVEISYEFIGKELNYYFSRIKRFHFAETDDTKAFTASFYIMKLLLGHTVKDCVDDFNKNFNKSKNIDCINLFIDSLNEAISYIKFELMKLPNYLRVFNVDISSNELLSNFCILLSGFVDSDITMKILDDLGIERKDFSEIISVLDVGDAISTSKVIKLIEHNKDRLLADKLLSPFSKHNIKNI